MNDSRVSRHFDIKDAKVIMEITDASILIDEETGTVFFRYRGAGIAFHPASGAWSTPLDFSEPTFADDHSS